MIRPVLALAALSVALPASAQIVTQPKRERYVQIAPGERCPRSTDEEVIVCGTRGERDRYRLDEAFRGPAPADAQSAEGRVEEAQAAGNTGIGACSSQGIGGFTGCARGEYDAWRAQRRQQRAVGEKALDD